MLVWVVVMGLLEEVELSIEMGFGVSFVPKFPGPIFLIFAV